MLIYKLFSTCEKSPYAILLYSKGAVLLYPNSEGPSAESDQGLHCPVTESHDIVEYLFEQGLP